MKPNHLILFLVATSATLFSILMSDLYIEGTAQFEDGNWWILPATASPAIVFVLAGLICAITNRFTLFIEALGISVSHKWKIDESEKRGEAPN